MSCSTIRTALADCLLKTDCVLKQQKTPSDCLQHHAEELPIECQHLRKAFFECKRGMLDMRKRFRGIEPGQGIKTAAQEEGGQ